MFAPHVSAARESRVVPALRTRSPRPFLLQRHAACTCGGSCPRCRQDADHTDMGHASDSGSEAPAIVHEVLRTPGHQLDRATRAVMEERFAHDLGPVRIHADAQAAASAQALDAHAYTVGHHVVFGPSRYAPHTDAGRHLLAHELAHVVQQDETRPPAGPIAIGGIDDPAEAAAQHAARAVVAGRAARVSAGGMRPTLQRQPQRRQPRQPAPVPQLHARQATAPPPTPLCSGQTDITQDFRLFVKDVPGLIATIPGIDAAEVTRLTGIADTVLHSEGPADIDQFTVVSCTSISSPIMLPGETASAFVDVTNRTLGLSTGLVADMATFRATPTAENLLPILTTVAHEKRHATIAGAAAVRQSGLQAGFDASYTDKAAYRVEEILTVSDRKSVV